LNVYTTRPGPTRASRWRDHNTRFTTCTAPCFFRRRDDRTASRYFRADVTPLTGGEISFDITPFVHSSASQRITDSGVFSRALLICLQSGLTRDIGAFLAPMNRTPHLQRTTGSYFPQNVRAICFDMFPSLFCSPKIPTSSSWTRSLVSGEGKRIRSPSQGIHP
jgi:hypothetical protein